MRAMILAAGRGQRMGALTADTPKPLLTIHGKYLIDYMLHALLQAGIKEIVINTSYHGDKIQTALGDGSRYGIAIAYSHEEERLETGGGIFQALPLLGDQPFLVVSCDIITDYPLQRLCQHTLQGLAHLVVVDNPDFHPQGDFGLRNDHVDTNATPRYTFANLGLYHPDLFAACQPGHFPLSKLLLPAAAQDLITGEHYQGLWHNVGTPEDIALVPQMG